MTRVGVLCLCILAATAGACASPTVGYDYDRAANLRSYRTYDWLSNQQADTGDKRVDNPLVDSRIRSAVERQLHSKGYTAAADRPDFLVVYHLALKDMLKGSSTQRYIGDRASGTFTTISDIHAYKEGTLLIDIVDGGSKQLVWRGTALAEVQPGMTPEERDKRVSRVVQAILAHFPPQ